MERIKGAKLAIAAFFALAAFSFCFLAIRSAFADKALAEKSAEWRGLYFTTEADAKRFLLYVDTALSDAETFAVEYVANEGYSKKMYKEISVAAQEKIHERYIDKSSKDNFDESAFALSALNSAYYYRAYQLLRERREMFFQDLSAVHAAKTWHSPDVHVLTLNPDDASDIKIEATFYSDDFNYRFETAIDIAPLVYNITKNEILISGEKNLSAPRYNISKWSFTAITP